MAHRRLIPGSSGHLFGSVSGRERVGNEAMVSIWFLAANGLVTKQRFQHWISGRGRVGNEAIPFSGDQFQFSGSREGVIYPYYRSHFLASSTMGRSNG